MRAKFLFLFLAVAYGTEIHCAPQIMLNLPVLTTVTQVSARVLTQNSSRAYLSVFNAGPSTAFVQFGTISQFTGTVVNPGSIAYKGFQVISGQTMQWNTPSVPGNSAYADSTGSAALTITEGK